MAFADDYNDVPARIREFREKYPDGSLQAVGEFRIVEVDGITFLAYTAAAYRSPDDVRPGIGSAWERVPGLTKFTQNSELQNAETSAWGRAIVATLAADTKKIASREDVESRVAEQEWYDSPEYAEQQAVPGLRTAIEGAIGKLDDAAKAVLKDWFVAENLPAVRRMNQAQCDKVLDHLFALPVGEGVSGDREVPVDEGLVDGALPPTTEGDAA